MSDSEQRTLRLKILSQVVLASWRKKGGDISVLYDVEAVDEEGKVPELLLRAFDILPRGTLQEFVASRYEREGEVSWTLRSPQGVSDLEVLRSELSSLTARVEALEGRLGEPEAEVHPAQDPDAPRGPSIIPPPAKNEEPF